MCTWFLEIAFIHVYVCVHVCPCVSTPEAINNYSCEALITKQTSSTAFHFLYMILAIDIIVKVDMMSRLIIAVVSVYKCVNM